MTRIVLATAAAAALCFAAPQAAESKKKPAPAATTMKAPAPAAEMKELTAMAGTWTVDETHEPSPWNPKGGKGKGTATMRVGPGGHSVILDYRSQSGPSANMWGHGIFTWDPAQKIYKNVWFDAFTPGVSIATGQKQGDRFVYIGEFEIGGKKIRYKDVVSDRTPASFTVTSYMIDGTSEKRMVTLKHTRVK
ncbi:MAG: DUF1579 family protein [Acidobacteria bacterium]|nr:DUF1579 family protein [Acidobacteriota bacterium]